MDPFWLKLVLSFFVGGSYIALTIWASERFDSKIGGILIGMPSTTLLSLIFIAWTQDTQVARAALPVMPAAIGIGTLYISLFVALYRFGEAAALLGSIMFWFVLALPLVLLQLDSLPLSCLLAFACFTSSIACSRRFAHRKLPRARASAQEFMIRSMFAGAVVAGAVLFGRMLGPLWGGLAACFPAAFTSSLLLISRKHGIEFTASVVRSMPYGTFANVFFIVTVYVLTPLVHFPAAMILGLLAAMLVAGVLHQTVMQSPAESGLSACE